MFDLIPRIIIPVALVIIIIIVIKKFPEASKYSQDKAGSESKEETIGARILSVLKYIGKRIRIFSVSIAGGIFSGIQKARKSKMKSSKINKDDILSDLVKDKLNLGQQNFEKNKVDNEINNEENEIIDLLEEAAEKLGSGNYKEAENNYIKVVTIDPKNIRAYKGLGRIYRKQDNINDALASYEQVLKIDLNDIEALEELEKLKFKK